MPDGNLKWREVQDPVMGKAYGATIGYNGITVVHIRVLHNPLTKANGEGAWLLTYNKVKHIRYKTKDEAIAAADAWFKGFRAAFMESYGENNE